MADLIPRALAALSPDRAAQELARRVAEVQDAAVVSAALVESASFVASVGLAHAGQLAAVAESRFQVAPAGARVYAQILDGFGTSVVDELRHLSLQHRRRP